MDPEPGADCPVCSDRLVGSECPSCHWKPTAPPAPEPQAKPARPKKLCAGCGQEHQFWTSLTPGEDGALRCASCHFGYLKRRAAAGQTCTEPGCTKTPAEHRLEISALIDKIGTPQEHWRTTPSLLERRNTPGHPLRLSVKQALGLADRAPDPTPAEWDDLERRKREALRRLDERR